eukprot:s1244_g5.t1
MVFLRNEASRSVARLYLLVGVREHASSIQTPPAPASKTRLWASGASRCRLVAMGQVMGIVIGAFSQELSISVRHAVSGETLTVVRARPSDTPAYLREHVLRATGDGGVALHFLFQSQVLDEKLTASLDGTARIWYLQSGDCRKMLVARRGGQVQSATFSHDGLTLLTVSLDGEGKLWCPESGRLLCELSGQAGGVLSGEFSADSKWITGASDDCTAIVWNAETGKCSQVLSGHDDDVKSAAFSPDASLVVTASCDGTAGLWMAADGSRLRSFVGHDDVVKSAMFSYDGMRIITASMDGTARVWNVETGECLQVLQGHAKAVNSAAFSPDDTLYLTTSFDGTVRVWAAGSGDCNLVLHADNKVVNMAQFSPDGAMILVASGTECVRLLSATTGECIMTLDGHEDWVRTANFSPDGMLIASASYDGTARVWSSRTGECLQTLAGHSAGRQSYPRKSLRPEEGAASSPIPGCCCQQVWTKPGLATRIPQPVCNLVSFLPRQLQRTWSSRVAIMMTQVAEQLAEIQEQQKASAQTFAYLAHQHEGWQVALDSILDRIDRLTETEERKLDYPQMTRTPQLPPLRGDPDGEAMQGSKSNGSTPQDDSRDNKLNTLVQQNQMNQKSETSMKLKRLVEQGLQDHLAANAARGVKTLREKIAVMVHSQMFEYAAGFVILANLVVIGIEAQLSLSMDSEFPELSWPWWMERIFLLVYCLEIFLRIVAGGVAVLKDVWFLMDLALVLVGWTALLFLPLAGVDALAAEKLLIVRGLRLLRLVRALRMINHFKVIWRLVYGLLTAGQTIISTTALILISLFVCSCVAVELIGKDRELLEDSVTGPIVQMYFRGIDKSLITLIQFVTLDSVASIYFPLIMLKPYLSVFFLGLIVVISIGLMNLVTAAVLENAMQAAVQDAEAEKSAMLNTVKDAIPELLKIFQSIDKDNSGILTHDEVESVEVDILPKKFLQTVHVNSMLELFDYLDVDQTGELTREEFIEGLLDLCLRDMPLPWVQMLKLLHLILGMSKKIDTHLEALRSRQTTVVLPSAI